MLVPAARFYRLNTEPYADRGGAVAAGAPGPVIATLVKTMTGLTSVDPEAYLRQTTEAAESTVTKESSNPDNAAHRG